MIQTRKKEIIWEVVKAKKNIKKQALLKCNLPSKLWEENHSLKKSSSQEAFSKNEELLSFVIQYFEVNNPQKNQCRDAG